MGGERKNKRKYLVSDKDSNTVFLFLLYFFYIYFYVKRALIDLSWDAFPWLGYTMFEVSPP